MTKRLILARHAEVDLRYKGQFLGSTDARLSTLGLRQASALAQSLRSYNSASILVSPKLRAIETAESLNCDYRIETDLREIDFGRWEGLTFKEISASEDSSLIEQWNEFDLDFAFPGGESLGGFVERISRTADRLTAHSSDIVIAVTHGGVIRAMICYLLGLDPKNYLLFDVKRASITTIDLYEGSGVLAGLSDICHLEGVV